MAIELTTTDDKKNSGVKILVYSESGMEKTRLILTMDNPVILDAEDGLLSIEGSGLQVIKVETAEDVDQAVDVLTSPEHTDKFNSIAVDSLSEIAEIKLTKAMADHNNDARRAVPEVHREITSIIRRFKNLDKDVYFIAKQSYEKDGDGIMSYMPKMPGKNLSIDLPYLLDTIMAMRSFTNDDGSEFKALLCHKTGKWQAKDRSGRLDQYEKPDLGAIIKKIKGVTNG